MRPSQECNSSLEDAAKLITYGKMVIAALCPAPRQLDKGIMQIRDSKNRLPKTLACLHFLHTTFCCKCQIRLNERGVFVYLIGGSGSDQQ